MRDDGISSEPVVTSRWRLRRRVVAVLAAIACAHGLVTTAVMTELPLGGIPAALISFGLFVAWSAVAALKAPSLGLTLIASVLVAAAALSLLRVPLFLAGLLSLTMPENRALGVGVMIGATTLELFIFAAFGALCAWVVRGIRRLLRGDSTPAVS